MIIVWILITFIYISAAFEVNRYKSRRLIKRKKRSISHYKKVKNIVQILLFKS